MIKFIKAAEGYLAKGLKLVPLNGIHKNGNCTCSKHNCNSQGKHPIYAKWQENLITSLQELDHFLAQNHNRLFNIGIATGNDFGIVAVDLDVNESKNVNGLNSFAQLTEQHGNVDTVTSETGGGGIHKIYSYPQINIQQGVNVFAHSNLPGIDIRSDGGFIVVPPSTHKSGKSYNWLPGKSPDEIDFAPLPEWFVKLLTAKNKDSHLSVNQALTNFEGSHQEVEIHEGSRNSQLASLAGRMRYQGKNEEEILTALLEINQSQCNPPLEENEVASIAKSIALYEPGIQIERDPIFPSEFYKALNPHKITIHNGNLCKFRYNDGIIHYEEICNFIPWIEVAEEHNNGETTELFYKVVGRHRNGTMFPAITMSSTDFFTNWPFQKWGHKAIVGVAPKNMEYIRFIIQNLSADISSNRVFTHLGWIELDKERFYLHTGLTEDTQPLQVRLVNDLSNYNLNTSSSDSEAQEAIILFLKLAEPKIIYPLLGLVALSFARELLSSINLRLTSPLFLVGKTGNGKSHLASLLLYFFGNLNHKAFPSSFRDTVNKIEKRAFDLKDSLLVIDDYYPGTNRKEQGEMDLKIQAISRLVGDNANRGRMTNTMKDQKSFPPRSTILCTGEQRPSILSSTILRYFFIEITRDLIKYDDIYIPLWKKRKALRAWSAKYLQWLATNWDFLLHWLPEQYEHYSQLSAEITPTGRIQETSAMLLLGTQMVFKFMNDIQWINENQYNSFQSLSLNGITEATKSNIIKAENDNPVQLFKDTMNELLATGTVYLKENNIESYSISPEFAIGYFSKNKEEIYLFPDRTFTQFIRALQAQQIHFTLTKSALWDQLAEAGILVSKNGRNDSQKRVGGSQTWVLTLKKDALVTENIFDLRELENDNEDLF